MNAVERDYKLEYEYYDKKPQRKKARASRETVRKQFVKAGLVKPGDGKVIHHKNGNPLDNRLSNLEILTHCQHEKKHGKECNKK